MLKYCAKHGTWQPPPARCPTCRPPGASWNPNRDIPAHNRWSRALKQATPYCQQCGATQDLQAHHTHGLNDPRGQVLCRSCHRLKDRYAR